MKFLALLLAFAVFAAACSGDTQEVADDTVVLTADVGDITPTASLIDAANKIEQAHEGIGNIIHHDAGNWDDGCGTNCGVALGDAIEKTVEAHDELGPDILSLYTWDNNQTVAHAFDAALYWLKETAPVDNATHHAEWQLGLLRDVLRGQVNARKHPALLGLAVVDATPKATVLDAYNKVEQAHEGIGNVIKNDISGDETCGDRCYAAMQDARKKNSEAWHELGDDILDITTWDHGRTVAHAFWAADVWLGQLEQEYNVDFGHHAEFQLGILRDVLSAASK